MISEGAVIALTAKKELPATTTYAVIQGWTSHSNFRTWSVSVSFRLIGAMPVGLGLVELRRRALEAVDVVQRLVAVLDLQRLAGDHRLDARPVHAGRLIQDRGRGGRVVASGQARLDAHDDVLEDAARADHDLFLLHRRLGAERVSLALGQLHLGGGAGQFHGAGDPTHCRSGRGQRRGRAAGGGRAPGAGAAGAAGASGLSFWQPPAVAETSTTNAIPSDERRFIMPGW